MESRFLSQVKSASLRVQSILDESDKVLRELKSRRTQFPDSNQNADVVDPQNEQVPEPPLTNQVIGLIPPPNEQLDENEYYLTDTSESEGDESESEDDNGESEGDNGESEGDESDSEDDESESEDDECESDEELYTKKTFCQIICCHRA
jgi:hypothetical protein